SRRLPARRAMGQADPAYCCHMVTNLVQLRNPVLRPADALEGVATAMVAVTARAIAATDGAGDLTLPQWRAPVVIAGEGGRRVGAVAARLGASVPSASRLLRRLQRRGLVHMDVDDSDRRAIVVRASQEGVDVCDQVMRRRLDMLSDALADAPLPPGSDRTLAAVEAALRRYA